MSTVKVNGAKNGGERVVLPAGQAASKYYPATREAVRKTVRKAVRPTKLRPSLTPGTVCIVLAGRFRGKRVVVLGQLEDTLVITGPYKINGVPLRRVNHRYVIATSAPKIDVSGVPVEKFTKAYFAKQKAKGPVKKDEAFFAESAPKKALPAERIADQKAVDAKLLASIKSIPNMKEYLAASFALSSGDRPHLMKF
ncbi:60S ribosomal protein L6 [Schizosaccharomyces japonicus yFS275]|uniref:60S ribosomal protein L6 n=1 Tax=Schizosaccharomyces japonicus (strain yFS275 / FY16936) TaxID=402676 RepID=B6K4V2_SCHJY|nr:60S ribosomal protein L6 [Schizosaccharomyces japonicus yFS275]EEB08509.1 60S ribosomal protein L6 [Schizosaccharomyces japonicus yFS275]